MLGEELLNKGSHCCSGLDSTFQELFGNFHETLASLINEHYDGKTSLLISQTGEIPVATSCLLPVGNITIVYTPTFPRGKYTTLDGMKATLRVIQDWNENQAYREGKVIQSVLCPGLGTYTGMCPEDVLQTVKEMAEAYSDWKNK
jgi:hypothetical protein